ncbi:diguanylate cyclase domain-containing protein [Massilia cavernae]|nr:diguanylate cyclase [Massilia cavernae]
MRQATSGFEGTGRSFTHTGKEAMVSYKPTNGVDWIVASVLPTDEVFHSAVQLRWESTLLALVLTSLLTPLACFIFYRALKPLRELGQKMIAATKDSSEQWRPSSFYSNDELGRLGRVFDSLMLERGRVVTELKQSHLVLQESEQRTRTITDSMPAVIGYIDLDHRYRFCNSAYKRFHGLQPEDMLGKTITEVFGDGVYNAFADCIEQALSGQRVSFERMVEQDGSVMCMQYEYVPDFDAYGVVRGFYSMGTDITAYKRAEQDLSSQQQLLRAVTDTLPALVTFVDKTGRIKFANRTHETWMRRPMHAIEGNLIGDLLGAQEMEIHQKHFTCALGGKVATFGFERQEADRIRHYQATYTPQFSAENDIIGVTCLVHDVTEAKLLERQLNVMARFDSLTGLPNRIQIKECISRAIDDNRDAQSLAAVMYLDLDSFKAINDTLGHQAGDLVLKEFGRRLAGCVRRSDTVGRLAGDEFVVILERLSNDSESTLVAEKILRAMEKPISINGVDRIVTTSIGIEMVSTEVNPSVETLLKAADEALYRSKQLGRNRYSFRSAAASV